MPFNDAININAPYVADDTVHANRTSAFNLIRQLLDLRDITEKHKKEQLSIGLWKWTEAEGVAPHAKYHTRLRSAGALNTNSPAKLNHEHVWPRSWLIEQLLARVDWSPDDLWDFLTDFGVACIVTVEEHLALGGVRGVGWERYERAGIEVHDLETNRPFVFPHLPLATGGLNAEPPTREELADFPDEVTEYLPGDEELPTVEGAIRLHAGPRASAFHALLARLEGEGVAIAVGTTHKGGVGDYLRIHDNALEEPTPAVAYLHWSGKLSLRLSVHDVPEYLMRSDGVDQAAHKNYGIRAKLDDHGSLDVAEGLLNLALEKVREP